jgi:FtsH-binding integral membrane protein
MYLKDTNFDLTLKTHMRFMGAISLGIYSLQMITLRVPQHLAIHLAFCVLAGFVLLSAAHQPIIGSL